MVRSECLKGDPKVGCKRRGLINGQTRPRPARRIGGVPAAHQAPHNLPENWVGWPQATKSESTGDWRQGDQRHDLVHFGGLQGTSLIRKRPPPMGPPQGPRHEPTVGSKGDECSSLFATQRATKGFSAPIGTNFHCLIRRNPKSL